MKVAIKFISAWKLKAITTIHVHVTLFSSATLFRDFFDATLESSMTKSVTQIDIYRTDNMDTDEQIEDIPEHRLEALSFKSLSVLTKLEVLKMTAACYPHELDDIFLEEVAAAWPYLRVLHISWSRPSIYNSPKIMLNRLAALLSKMQCAHRFEYHFAPPHPLNTLPKGNLQSTTITILVVSHSERLDVLINAILQTRFWCLLDIQSTQWKGAGSAVSLFACMVELSQTDEEPR